MEAADAEEAFTARSEVVSVESVMGGGGGERVRVVGWFLKIINKKKLIHFCGYFFQFRRWDLNPHDIATTGT